jgi:lipid II:glycine glycyltransferase (peptidoglycan interpeptide bridge formation enzyme)
MRKHESRMVTITDSIDIKQWSEFVHNHPYGNIFQTPEMRDVYERTKHYEPISLAVVDDTGEILVLVQAVVIRELGGVLGSFSARSVIHGGPLFVDGEKSEDVVVSLMKHYDKIVHKKVLYTEIRMLSDIPNFDLYISQNGYISEEHFNASIGLNKSVDDIWNQIKRDKKRGIKKAEKNGITVEECKNRDEIQIFYNLVSETYKNAKIPLADISLFESVFDILVPVRRAVFLFAKHDNKYIATQIALMDNNTIYAWYTGAIREYLSYHPGDLLIWHLLKYGTVNGYQRFDFGGGGTRTEHVNLREYKARFGAEFPDYGRYKKIHSPIKMKIAEKGFEMYRKMAL